MQLFNKNQCIRICLKNTNPYVSLAMEDLKNDFKRVSEAHICPEIVFEEEKNCIVIEENVLSETDPIINEGFSIKSDGDVIRISAKSYLGTMWGIYTFSEKFLGVDPCYLFNDLETEKHTYIEIPDVDISEQPESFKFRGVFINDEDLLSGWKDGGGIRYVDQTCYALTVEQDVMNKVIETVLRLKLNLVIPATLLDIDNPSEKILADCVSKRGIYLSQHHIEPLGVSSFTFNNYCTKKHINAEFSYIKNPLKMEEAWRYYANKWAQYNNVVWQIGLRGMGDDRPIWQEDIPTEDKLKEYGEFISKAYAKQVEIINEATEGRAKYFTTTLWMEGSELMEKGFLKTPDNAIVVFADAGLNQMFGNEYYNIKRNKNSRYGIYYHLQYIGSGPHLAPQTGLDKLYYNTNLAYMNGDNFYYIMNVSNLREFVFELKAYSQMAWNIKSFSKEKYIYDYCDKFGDKKEYVKELILKYFNKLPFLKTEYLSEHSYNKYFNFYTEDSFCDFKNFVIKEGDILERGKKLCNSFHQFIKTPIYEGYYEAVKKSISSYKKISYDFESLSKSMSSPLNKHIEVKWLLYTKTLLYIYQWYINIYEAKQYCDLYDCENMKKSLKLACENLEEYLQYRKCAEYGAFENWYRGDLKMNIKQRLADTRRLLGQTPDFC